MRKLVESVLMALATAYFCGSAFAGNTDACEDLKDDPSAPKGLYGLCIAFHNAGDAVSRERIRTLYALKAGDLYDPIIPGDEVYSCPCWTPELLAATLAADNVVGVDCGQGTNISNYALYVDAEVDEYPFDIIFEAGQLVPGVEYCSYAGTTSGAFEIADGTLVSSGDIADCEVQILAVCETQ